MRAAIEVVNIVCQSGVDIPDDFFDPLLHACERSCEFDLVSLDISLSFKTFDKENLEDIGGLR